MLYDEVQGKVYSHHIALNTSGREVKIKSVMVALGNKDNIKNETSESWFYRDTLYDGNVVCSVEFGL